MGTNEGGMAHSLNMKTVSLFAGLAAVLCVGAACTQAGAEMGQAATTNSPAPAFSAKASDGKTYTLKDLTAKKPAFLYFVKSTCGSNPMAVKLFARVYKAY